MFVARSRKLVGWSECCPTLQDTNGKVWLGHNMDFWAGIYLLSNVTVIADFTVGGVTKYSLITWVSFTFCAHQTSKWRY